MSAAVKIIKKTAAIVSYGMAGAAIVLLFGYVLYINNKPDLDVWHKATLNAEFTANSHIQTIEEYRALEDRLFDELQHKIINKVPPNRQSGINRFTPGSLSDPGRWPTNWNRSYEFNSDDPVAGVLLLHGLSDSPYVLRRLASDLHSAGATVLGLRLPGHGTAPSGLVDVRWQDMAAAVRLAMRHLQSELGGKPLYIVGYSNGAALAVHYALTALDETDLPQVQRLVMISPAIAITPLARFAVWQARLGHLLGLEKLAWQDVLPEYDPYKYQSFAVNAGDLAFQLTTEIQQLIGKHAAGDTLQHFPPALVFLSAVDATVSARAVVTSFFAKLSSNQHELVVFDLNRRAGIEHLYTNDPKQAIQTLLGNDTLPFTFSVISNRDPDTTEVVMRSNKTGSAAIEESRLGLAWPDDMYSLSHVALSIAPDDPLYGGPGAEKSPGITLGNVALRGEKGTLTIPARDMLRQRWNPFYAVIHNKIDDFLMINGS
jgi:alpha-beta hydrolase superfamily lysophospholipase